MIVGAHMYFGKQLTTQHQQVLMFYHLKTRHRVNTVVHMVGKLKSREKGLITKEHIVTHTHLNFVFKHALHFSILAIKHFNRSYLWLWRVH